MKGFFSKSQLMGSKQFASTISHCGVCGLYKHCKTPKMKPYGRGKKNILILAESPGEKEDEIGRPLVGKSGMLLESAMDRLGINLSRDCIRSNACICHPINNETPNDEKIEACRANVIKLILEMKPVVIIPLGMSAVKSIIGWLWKDERLDNIGRWVGLVMPNQQLNCWICPTWHPAYLQRQQDKTLDLLFTGHLRKAILKINKRPFEDNVYITNIIEKIYEPFRINVAINEMINIGGLCAFDYETNMLKPDNPKGKIISCSISNGKRTIAFPWSNDVAESAMVYFLKSKKVGKIASNLKFEDRWTRAKMGFGVVNWAWDTMLAAHVIDHRPKITSLKFQAFATLGQSNYNSHIEGLLNGKGSYKINRIDEIDLSDLLTYNGLDGLYSYKLAKKQMKILEK